jgi:hypothetical protein
VADAIHIATYYVGNILIEANERHPTSARETIYRPASFAGGAGAPYGAPPPYATGYPPMPQQMPAANPYAAPPMPPPGTPLQTQQIYIPNDLVGCIIGKGGSKINEIRQMSASTIKIMEPGTNASGQPGAGAGSEHERLVVITGAPANIQMAVSMLYTVSRLFCGDESFNLIVCHSDSNKKSKSSCANSRFDHHVGQHYSMFLPESCRLGLDVAILLPLFTAAMSNYKFANDPRSSDTVHLLLSRLDLENSSPG